MGNLNRYDLCLIPPWVLKSEVPGESGEEAAFGFALADKSFEIVVEDIADADG